jgi:hypothetical protein
MPCSSVAGRLPRCARQERLDGAARSSVGRPPRMFVRFGLLIVHRFRIVLDECIRACYRSRVDGVVDRCVAYDAQHTKAACEALLDAGALATVVDGKRTTPLHYAVRYLESHRMMNRIESWMFSLTRYSNAHWPPNTHAHAQRRTIAQVAERGGGARAASAVAERRPRRSRRTRRNAALSRQSSSASNLDSRPTRVVVFVFRFKNDIF